MESGEWGISKNMKKNRVPPIINQEKRTRFMSWIKPVRYVFVVLLGTSVLGVSFFLVKSLHAIKDASVSSTEIVSNSGSMQSGATESKGADGTLTFPIGVNPDKKQIVESPDLDKFVVTFIEPKSETLSMHNGWFGRILGKLAIMNWYQNLASISSRILVVESGERKEEIAEHFGKILKWNATENKEFLALIQTQAPVLTDGKFLPSTYTVSRGATPQEVAPLILEKFDTEVVSRYGPEIERMVPLNDALTIASLLEREAYDFEDMRHISGVIWNRLFVNMKLQIDATLQYAKGSKPSQPWWPRVQPSDKYLASAYNTYENKGLPPAPIANPSLESIIAALNPTKTDCMFYFHDAKGVFHCTKTYDEHVALLKQYYGRGK